MIKFSSEESDFLKRQKVARVSTISDKGWPQTTPIIYVFDGKSIYFATDFDTKKYKNLKSNKKVSVVVDVYSRTPHGITMQGNAEILEKGHEFGRALRMLINEHEYYKKNPFKAGEAPIIRITPIRRASW